MKERISLLRECQDRDRGSRTVSLGICRRAAACGSDRERGSAIRTGAPAYLDGATAFVLEIVRVDRGPSEQLFALHVSDECRLLGEQLAQAGNPSESNRAADWQVRILALLATQDSIRPDVVMSKACALADSGNWERARELVQTLYSRRHSLKAEPPLVRLRSCVGIIGLARSKNAPLVYSSKKTRSYP